MKIFDIYLFKSLALATLFVALILTFIIFLTQSLRFLEVIINAGSGSGAFWILTALALPRFFEIILPLSLMSATLFLYNKMTIDSELIAMRAGGHSSFALAKPAIILSLTITTLLWITTMWIAPLSLAKMQHMRVELKADLSNFLFRESVFNKVGTGLTVYIRKRSGTGELQGLMIHDTRDETKRPSTVLARRGMIISGEQGHQVIVFDGARHEYNPKSKILQKLVFDRYTIDLPENIKTRERWAEPDERTINQLLNPDLSNPRDIKNLHDFKIEIHRRITAPLLALSFPLIVLTALLLGPLDRRGQSKRIITAILVVIIIQSLFIAGYNIARNSSTGLIIIYAATLLPIAATFFLLNSTSENIRRRIFYTMRGTA